MITLLSLTWTPVTHLEEGSFDSSHVDYGVRDAKGRAVGGFVRIERRSVRLVYENGGCTEIPIPVRFYVSTRATRDGNSFGAIPNATGVATLEEAKALGEKKLQQAKRRFVRLAAKGEGKQWSKS